MMTMTVALVNPVGTIQKFGTLPAGALVETLIVGPIQVTPNPSGQALVGPPEEHHLTDFKCAVAKGAAGTIFRLYRSSDGVTYVQIDAIEIGDYGTYTSTYGTSVKIKAGEYWKVTLQQSTVARASIKVGGQARNADVRD